MHAVDVCQACIIMFQECQPYQFPDLEIAAFFFAAMVELLVDYLLNVRHTTRHILAKIMLF